MRLKFPHNIENEINKIPERVQVLLQSHGKSVVS